MLSPVVCDARFLFSSLSPVRTYRCFHLLQKKKYLQFNLVIQLLPCRDAVFFLLPRCDAVFSDIIFFFLFPPSVYCVDWVSCESVAVFLSLQFMICLTICCSFLNPNHGFIPVMARCYLLQNCKCKLSILLIFYTVYSYLLICIFWIQFTDLFLLRFVAISCFVLFSLCECHHYVSQMLTIDHPSRKILYTAPNKAFAFGASVNKN